MLPNTIVNENRLQHVYAVRTIELILQIVYDVGSNEISGITGAILGAILGVGKVATFVIEYNYDIQDECQEILERRQISEIKTNLSLCKPLPSGVVTPTTKPLVTPAAPATPTTPGSCVSDQTLGIHDQKVQDQLDKMQDLLNAIKGQTAQHNDQTLRLFIEDHLDSCRPLGSMLLPD